MDILTITLSVPKDVLFHNVSGEAVILNTHTGKYFGLDEVGTRMWTLLSEHGRVEPALRTLLEEYDVTQEQLQADLHVFIENLVAHGLLDINDAAQAA
jgi:hypothetical protein